MIRSWNALRSSLARMTFFVATLTALAGAARAGDIAVTVKTPSGAPVADAVVSLAAPFSGPIKFAWPYRMAQQNVRFDPFVLVVPVGADVSFPNFDKVRHHVYSFSPAKTFEIKLYGHDETRVVRFDKPGVVELGCNIHDVMSAYIVVVDTPYVAKTDAQGVAVIHNAPAGPQTLRIWQPFIRAPRNVVTQAIQSARDGTVQVRITAEIRAAPEHHQSY